MSPEFSVGAAIQPLTWLKISRPGLWFQTLWLYMLPLASPDVDWSAPGPWVGLLYVSFPLNLLVYGWNDTVDFDIDQQNPRKDSWLFGARATREALRSAMGLAIALQLVFAAVFVLLDDWRMLGLMAGIIAVNATYNARVGGLRGRPPFDLVNPLGYLLVVQIGVWISGAPAVPWQALVYLVLFCLHAQLIGEVMDYWPDREAGRVTSSTVIGVRPTKAAITLLVAAEAAMLWFVFQDPVLGGMLTLGVAWLLLDLFVIWRDRRYTRKEFTLAGIGMNVAGVVSMAWVLWRGTLLAPVWP
jgi:4-hydroxybenzoate polyprenyltransferase